MLDRIAMHNVDMMHGNNGGAGRAISFVSRFQSTYPLNAMAQTRGRRARQKAHSIFSICVRDNHDRCD
ncbi:hypothetical protein CWO91_08050 [Bradyrhizobium genosp. SA-3]|nr:hypothetical protein CWO91_08050 [Bradyrhizobium genosp. SA-3]